MSDDAGPHSPGKRPDDELLVFDSRDVSLKAPTGLSPQLREAYESVAAAVCQAVEILQFPSPGLFREQADELVRLIRVADAAYLFAESQLLVACGSQPVLHQAMMAARRVQDACGHVILGSVAFGNAEKYLATIPRFNLRQLLLRMREEVCRAGATVLKSAGSVTEQTGDHRIKNASPGRPPKDDPEEARIMAAWDTGKHRTKKELAEELGFAVNRVEKVIARVSKRRRRSADK